MLLKGRFQFAVHDRQRRLEFMRRVQGELADARKRLIQPLRHGVKDLGKAVKLVAIARAGQAFTQVVLVNALGGPGERRHRRKRPAHHPPAPAQCQQRRRHPAPEDDPEDLPEVTFVRVIRFRPLPGALPGGRRLRGECVIRQYPHRQQRHEHDPGIPQCQAGANAHPDSFIT